ncbi:MAG: hypothetical protein HYV28_12750 [Ignavibacteriales bacterium]|nr:hypothetical protein [Ignavibacteriales bacterium]
MKRTTKNYTAIFIGGIILIGSFITIYACSFYEDDSYVGFFAPQVCRTGKYTPFFRVTDLMFLDDIKENNVHDFDTINIHSWYNYFNKAIKWDDLYSTVYHYSTEEIDTMIFRLKIKTYPASRKITDNAVLYYRDSKLISDFLFYLGYAKRCEPYATASYPDKACRDSVWAIEWTRIEPITGKKQIEYLLEGGQKQIKNTKSQFIKERYMFQVCRLLFQSGRLKECCEYFENNIEKFTVGQSIKYRFMSYAAGAYFKVQNYAKANYLFSKVFDNCAELRRESVIGFHPQEEADFNEALNLAQNAHEKAVMWFLLGYYDSFRGLQEMFKLEPKSELLDVLLTRYLDILEESLNSERWQTYPESDRTIFSNVKDFNKFFGLSIEPSELIFVKEVAIKNNTNKPYLWDIAAGYLSIIKGNFRDADSFLKSAAKKANKDELVTKQVRILHYKILHGWMSIRKDWKIK